jgi:hypothetical protein
MQQPMPAQSNVYELVAAHSKKQYEQLLAEADQAISDLESEFPLRDNPHVLGVGYGLVYEGGLNESRYPADHFAKPTRMTTGIRIYHAHETDAIALGPYLRRTQQASRINFVHIQMPKLFAATCGDGITGASGTGTLGCVVERAGTRYILSNSHVLGGASHIGSPVTHAGAAIATLSESKDVDYTAGVINNVDGAIAEIHPSSSVSTLIHSIGPIVSTVRFPLLHQSVMKHGLTTGFTVGLIMAPKCNLRIPVGLGSAEFCNLIEIEGVGGRMFGDKGDSGSLIVDALLNMPVGLLVSGSPTSCFAIPIQEVLDEFRVTIVP